MNKKIVCSFIVFALLFSAMLLSGLGGVKVEGAVVLHSSVYQGDLVLTGNNVTTIENRRFDINGSIIVEENAKLILKNAIINFTQTYNSQHNMTFQNPANGNPRLQVENATITASNYYFWVHFYDNSSATMFNLTVPSKISLVAHGSSSVAMSNSTTYALYAQDSSAVNVSESTFGMLWGPDSSTVTVSNCTISSYLSAEESSVVNVSNSTIRELIVRSDSVDCRIFGLEPGFFSSWNYSLDCSAVVAPGGYAPEVTLKDSQIEGWRFDFLVSSNATISNSTIKEIDTRDSSVVTASNSIINRLYTHQYSVVWLVNSTYSSYYIYHESKVYVSWYLDVHVVDSIDQDVPSANVTVTYPNATVAESKLTDANGWTRLTLMEKMINATDSYPIGNYNVTAKYEIHTGQQSVNMTGNQEITITLPFIIPEFPQALILPLLMTITLIIGVLSKRRSILHKE